MSVLTDNLSGDKPEGRAYVIDWFRRYWLAVWFFVIDGIWLSGGPGIGTDGSYIGAAQRFWQGIDPWATSFDGWWFAAPPPTLLVLAPFGLVPEPVAHGVLIAAAVAGGVWTVRHLGLPWWWLAFPPLVNAMLGGALDALLVPFILGGIGWAAPFLKLYAAVPLAILGQWRQLAICGVVMLVTLPWWPGYLGQLPELSGRLAAQSGNVHLPILATGVMLVALVLMGREKAAWMAVPALWPSTQFYYRVLALPALTPLAAGIMAVPSEWSPLAACMVLMLTKVAGSSPLSYFTKLLPLVPVLWYLGRRDGSHVLGGYRVVAGQRDQQSGVVVVGPRPGQG